MSRSSEKGKEMVIVQTRIELMTSEQTGSHAPKLTLGERLHE